VHSHTSSSLPDCFSFYNERPNIKVEKVETVLKSFQDKNPDSGDNDDDIDEWNVERKKPWRRRCIISRLLFWRVTVGFANAVGLIGDPDHRQD